MSLWTMSLALVMDATLVTSVTHVVTLRAENKVIGIDT